MIRTREAVVLAIVLAPTAAYGRPCERPSVSHVQATLGGGTDELRAEIEKDLAAELSRDDIEVCESADRAPIAQVDVQIRERVAEIRIQDALTSKAVSRSVTLPAAPLDVVALTVALAADELLRASWAELALKGASAKETPAPRVAVEPPRTEQPTPPAPDEPRRNELGARGVFSWFSVGQAFVGADVFYRREIVPLLDVEVAILGRRGMPVDAPHGAVSALAIGGGGGIGLWPLRFDPVRLGVVAAVDVAYVSIEGQANEGAGQGKVDGPLVAARGALAATLDVPPVRFHLEIGGGAPIVGLEALDDQEVVAGASDGMIRGDLGLGVTF